MRRIKVTFFDGSTKIFNEGQILSTVDFFQDRENPRRHYPAQSEHFTLWNHTHDGLVPSFLEVLANAKYFSDVENPKILYSVQSVAKIEIV